ncbi:MAG: hypothetical protein SNH55_01265 [Rikenellaceae bacterium]
MFREIMNMSIYKKGIWLYLFLLIFEGALRKWFLPSLATPLLLVREPIVIWLVMVGLGKGWLQSGYVSAIMIVSTLSLLLSLAFGHGNVFVGLYGWRIYFFHIPFVFVMGKLLDRNDVLLMGKFIIYVSLLMTVIIVRQFSSDQSDWINMGIGGEGSAGFEGAMGYFRPSGTFSFTSGYIMFQSLVGCLLCFYVFMNDSLGKLYRLPQYILFSALGAYIISIPMSISRTHFFQTVVFMAFVAVMAVFNLKYKERVVKFAIWGVAAFSIASVLGLMGDSMEAFTSRFEAANTVEGGVENVIGGRYIGGLLNSLLNFDIPFAGFGVGIATNAGAKMVNANMYSFFNGENEWSRIIGECGLLIGWAIILIRLLISFELFQYAWYQMRNKVSNLLPWFLSAAMLLSFPQGQMGIPTNLGFCIFITGITLAALKIPANSKSI